MERKDDLNKIKSQLCWLKANQVLTGMAFEVGATVAITNTVVAPFVEPPLSLEETLAYAALGTVSYIAFHTTNKKMDELKSKKESLENDIEEKKLSKK